MAPLSQRRRREQQREQFLLSPEYRGLYRARELFLDNGRLEKASDVCQLLSFVFQQYKARVSKLTLILPPLVTESQQRHIQKFAFEELDVDQVLITNGAVFALYASGRTEGLVVNVGDTTSYVLPVLNNLTTKLIVTSRGGRMVSKYLLNQLYEVSNGAVGSDLHAAGNPAYDLELSYAFKHRVAVIQSLGLRNLGQRDEEMVSFTPLSVEGVEASESKSGISENVSHVFTLRLPRQDVLDAFELLFDPLAAAAPTLVEAVSAAVRSVPAELQARLLGGVLVAGGSASASLCARLQEELQAAFPRNTCKVYQLTEGRLAHYKGAVACAQLNAFQGFYADRNGV